MQLKILSWNIWCGTYFDKVVSFLKQEQPDIIALQEVLEEKNGNAALRLAQELNYEYVYSLTMQMPARFLKDRADDTSKIKFGNAILSKHKIINSRIYELTPEENKRPVVQADIEINGEVIHVFSLHLKHAHQEPSDLQNRQADELIKIITHDRSIVMGDFNCLPDSYPIQTIARVMKDTEPNKNTPTWCQYIEGCLECKIADVKYKLDYIFVSNDFKFSSFKVGSSDGSDHLPISAIIEV